MAMARRVEMAMAMARRVKLSTPSVTSSSSIAGVNCQFRRWYILPSQLSPIAADYLANTGINLAAEWANPCIYPLPDAELNTHAVRSAKFAINAQNKEGNLQFIRVLRASSSHNPGGGHKYYVTFEALRGKADVDVYYAEVIHRESELELINCQLVDDSFSSPRYASSDSTKPHDPLSIIQEMLDSGISLPKGLEKIDSPSAKVIFDIKNFEIVYEYALFAVTTHNEKEDDQVHLKNIAWACKSKVHDNWIYRLVLEATNKENEHEDYYAIVKLANGDKSLELMEWYSIPGAFLQPSGKEAVERYLEMKAKRNPNRKVGCDL